MPPVSLFVSTKFDGIDGSIADVPNLGTAGGAWNLKPGVGDQCIISALQSKYYSTSLSGPCTNPLNGAASILRVPSGVFTDDTECSIGLWLYLDAVIDSTVFFTLGIFDTVLGLNSVLLYTYTPTNDSTAFGMRVNGVNRTNATRFDARVWNYIEIAQSATRAISLRVNGNLIFTHATVRNANSIGDYNIELTGLANAVQSVFYINDLSVNQSSAPVPPYAPPGPLP